ncbi:membrane protein [Stenotrophomonas geniculata N1]|uniref:Membrane protein n=2 Tax=Stenotrophomonas geniculata TaxID=86188 RepID=A0A0L8ABW2_9GAMM|nr:membrane protein [Stenotrophomonas geniculata N1]
MMLMKLQLASMAALIVTFAGMLSSGTASAGVPTPPGSITRCEPFEVERYRFHQHCIVTMPDVDGEIFLSEYWVDEYGNPYLM